MTIEQLEKISWLNRAFQIENKVESLEALVEHDRERAQRITANCNSDDKGKSTGGKNNSVYNSLMILAETEEKYHEALNEYNIVRKEIEAAIESMHDNELETIMRHRYLTYKTWEQIAEAMDCSRMTVHRKHLKSLDKMLLNVTL